MVKNIVIVLLVVAVGVFAALVLSGRLVWVSQEDAEARTPEAILAKAVEIQRPFVISLGGEELLCVPRANLSGENWHVSHGLYIYEGGELKPLHLR